VPQTDPFGVVHRIIDYPGVPVDHALVEENHGILKVCAFRCGRISGYRSGRRKPSSSTLCLRLFRRQYDDWRIGKGAVMYYPVAMSGACFRRRPHASQGDSELCGTAIECSLTGTFS